MWRSRKTWPGTGRPGLRELNGLMRDTSSETGPRESDVPVLSRRKSGSRAIVRKVRIVRQVRKSRESSAPGPCFKISPQPDRPIRRQCQKSTREKVEYRKMKSKCHGTCYLEAGICDKTGKMKKAREKRAEKPP